MTLYAPMPLPLPPLNHSDDCGPLYSWKKEDMKARSWLLRVWRLQEALTRAPVSLTLPHDVQASFLVTVQLELAQALACDLLAYYFCAAPS